MTRGLDPERVNKSFVLHQGTGGGRDPRDRHRHLATRANRRQQGRRLARTASGTRRGHEQPPGHTKTKGDDMNPHPDSLQTPHRQIHPSKRGQPCASRSAHYRQKPLSSSLHRPARRWWSGSPSGARGTAQTPLPTTWATLPAYESPSCARAAGPPHPFTRCEAAASGDNPTRGMLEHSLTPGHWHGAQPPRGRQRSSWQPIGTCRHHRGLIGASVMTSSPAWRATAMT
jgi:hypothetical protein